MARPRKDTVEYFPHTCNHGKTLFILEERYGNDGYAFWFKLLELLGNTSGHAYDASDNSAWLFLVAKTRVSEVTATEILDTLAKLEAIDAELWQEKIIWSDNFLLGLANVYKKRQQELPVRPVSGAETTPVELVSGDGKQPKESSKGSKGSKGTHTGATPFQEIVSRYNSICVSLPKVQKVEERKPQIAARWRVNPDLDTFQTLFTKAESSDFLTGRRGTWRASFDWLMKPGNFAKVLEGNYDGRKGKAEPEVIDYADLPNLRRAL